MNKNTSKVLLFLIVVLVASLSVGCGSSTPNIAGLWEADFWNDAFIRLSPDLNLFVYADRDAEKNNDYYDYGKYILFEQDGLNCFGFGKFEHTITEFGMIVTGLSGRIEYASDDHIILTLDERCKYAGWKVWATGVDVEKLNLRRIE